MAKPNERLLDELHSQVELSYLSYMMAENVADRVARKEKLIISLRKYLCVAPHDMKYIFPETGEILRRSAIIQPHFDPFEASIAWDSIGTYAVNMMWQPWRREFQELYGGFFRQQVNEILPHADIMFELMGFNRVGNSLMAITGVLDPDRISFVSKDSFMASMECELLREIWDDVQRYYDITWEEILDYRENSTGHPQQVIKTLKFRRRQQLYERHALHQEQGEVAQMHVPLDFVYGSNMGYYNRRYYNYGSPNPARAIREPPYLQELPPSSSNSPAHSAHNDRGRRASDFKAVNVGSQPNPQHELPESYVQHANNPSFESDQSSIPGGQLIELDSTQFQIHTPPSEFLESDDDSASGGEKNGKAKKDKEADEAEKSGGKGAKGKKSGLLENRESGSKNGGDKKNDPPRRIMRGMPGSSSFKETRRPMDGEHAPDNRRSPVIKRDLNPPTRTRVTYKKGNDSEIEIYLENSPEPTPRHTYFDDDFYDEDDDDDSSTFSRKWECITCTFMNTRERKICEMCCKSKNPGSDAAPRPEAGIVCKKCTLVNDKNNNFCEACGKRLTLTAVYI